MGRFFDAMELVIRSHGGTVEKFIGDAVMAVFGIPRSHEDDPVRAVRASNGMRAALEGLNAELERDHGIGIQIRIGVNTGEVVAGDPSSGQRLVTGDAVNVAARLEQAASPGEIVVGETTYRLVKDAVEVTAMEPLELKGKSAPVPAYRLDAVLADVAGHERHLDSPLVGRTKELEMLERALDRARTERTSQLFTLLGSAGVGKSRIVHEFLAGPASGAIILRGRCLSYGEGITFFPLAEVVQRAAGIAEGDSRAIAREKLVMLLADAPDGAMDRLARLRTVRLGRAGRDRGRVLGRPQDVRAPRSLEFARHRVRRHPLGRTGVPRPGRAPRGLDEGRRRPAARASHGRSCSRSGPVGAAGR